MASLESLPADRRAVLQLVLQHGRSYDEIARLLSIDRSAVRQRAVNALEALGPQADLAGERRQVITDYLLGQLDSGAATTAQNAIAAAPGERAWARVVASELTPLAGSPLPVIPAAATAPPAPAPVSQAAAPAAPAVEPKASKTGRSRPARRSSPDRILPPLGAVVTVLVAYLTVRTGTTSAIAGVALAVLFFLVVIAFVVVPHWAVAGTIAAFCLVPVLKVFVSPSVGGLKDLICVAAISAAAILIVFRKQRLDARVAGLVALFIALYIVNAGHAHGAAWAQGLRLTGEPTLLLIVGMVLPDPRRTLRFALGALVVVGAFVALYGLLQQVVGPHYLVNIGYAYTTQVREISGHLRSFGTLDDPFAYAALLYFSVAAVFFWLRRGTVTWAVGTLIMFGLAASFVRTAVPVVIAFVGLVLVRRGKPVPAMAFAAATVVIAGLTIGGASGTQVQQVSIYFSNGGSVTVQSVVPRRGSLLLNGRVSAWTAAVGTNPVDWAFGRGVGTVGTAAERAGQGLIGAAGATSTAGSSPAIANQHAVDSGYFATVADVGIIGLIVQLALLWRLISLGVTAARRQETAGWVALALLTAMLIDAATRASFNGFPTAFAGMLITGLALAAAAQTDAESLPLELRPMRR